MTWPPEPEQDEPELTPDIFDCPGCGTRLVWEDATIFGCTCGWTFYETDAEDVETTFESDGL